MKNLQKLDGVNELSNQELQTINGGIVCGGLCIAGIAFVAGLAIGVIASEIAHHH